MLCLVSAALHMALKNAAAEEALRPNVLLIMTDDQGYGDITSHGNPIVRTPVLDRLAASGARFEHFYVSPVCAPTRASLLTGRYHLRAGVHGVTRGYETMRAEELTLAEALKSAGYATGAFGKWHNGRHMPSHPNGQGFDEFVGFCGGHWNRYFDADLEHNGQPLETSGYIADVLTQAAMRFISANQRRPWFCYVPYNTPHSPWRVPDEYWEKYAGHGLDPQAQCAYAMVENIDWNVGRMLDQLARLGLSETTIVLFLTDNGANSDRYNAGMKGRKGAVDEGGIRVPLLVRYPRAVRAGTRVDRIAAHIDLMPTLLELCGVEKPSGPEIDGVSLVPLLSGQAENWPDRLIFADRFRGDVPNQPLRGSVRSQRWRAVSHPRWGWQLYDIQADPAQQHDVARQHPEVVDHLAVAFDEWFAGCGAETLGYHPVPVGHPARTVFELPANEALLDPGYGQGIKYTGDTASGYANCWITDWTSTAASASWLLQVHGSNRYRVELQYTLDPKSAGSRVAVEVSGQRLEQQLDQAHDPPLRDKPDRVLPANNYQEKESWARTVLGEVELGPGPATLRVRAVAITGDRAMDLKSVRLVRLGLPQ